MPRVSQKHEDFTGLSNLPKFEGNARKNASLLDLEDTGYGGFGTFPIQQPVQKPLVYDQTPKPKPKPKNFIEDQFRTMEQQGDRRQNDSICAKILEVNTLLANGKFESAEYALGRPLTASEITNRSITNPNLTRPRSDSYATTQWQTEPTRHYESRHHEVEYEDEDYEKLPQIAGTDEKKESKPIKVKGTIKTQPATKSTQPATKPTQPATKPKLTLKKEGKGFATRVRKISMVNLVPFGRLELDMDKLDDKDIISVVYPHSRKKVPNLKNHHASPALKFVIASILGGLNPKLDALTESEIEYLKKLCHVAQIDKKGAIPSVPKKEPRMSVKKMTDQFKVLTGEIEAGNDSQLIRQQLASLLATMVQQGLITEEQAHDATQSYLS